MAAGLKDERTASPQLTQQMLCVWALRQNPVGVCNFERWEQSLFAGQPSRTRVDLQVRFEAVCWHFVGEDHIAQAIVQLSQLEFRQRRQLLVKQRLNRVRRVLNGSLQGAPTSGQRPAGACLKPFHGLGTNSGGGHTSVAAMTIRLPRRRDAIVR